MSWDKSSTRHRRLKGATLQRRNREFFAENPLCAACLKRGKRTIAVEVDHVVPLFKGGADTWENLQGLCAACHQFKSRQDRGQRPSSSAGADGMPLDPNHPWNR